MRRNSFTVVVLSLLLSVSLSSLHAQMLTGPAANALLPNVVRAMPGKLPGTIGYAAFAPGKEIPFGAFRAFAQHQLHFPSNVSFEILNALNDELGYTHHRYQQTINGHRVENSMLLLHVKDNKIVSLNGDMLMPDNLPAAATVTDAAALATAKNYVGASVYKWELPSEEARIKEAFDNQMMTYVPQGELVYFPINNEWREGNFRLAWKFDIYAHKPLSRQYIYIDALTGAVIGTENRLHDVDAQATAHTQYSGIRTITTDSNAGSFRLREAARGSGIRTYNAQQAEDPQNTDFIDADNTWNNINANLDQYATDAHFASEKTYDYFMSQHNHNSINGNGFALVAYVHVEENMANAFWDGSTMNYGDGNGTSIDPFTTLDIGGHEIVHGLTQFTADLVYQNEPGAINESFSDIFGVTIQQYVDSNATIDWLMGQEIGITIRSMSNPNAFGDPDTYQGTNWEGGTFDNGGVHINSGVGNLWYKLITAGGTGTNDNAVAYNITGLGIDKAGKIAFRTLANYLTPNSVYYDLREYSLIATQDLYGACTNEMQVVGSAWHAVGVGAAYVAAANADFKAGVEQFCSVPVTIDFINLSSNASTYDWAFGDGGTANTQTASHTYTTYGTFNVSLSVSSTNCGSDQETKQAYIVINDERPVAADQTICDGQTATIPATAGGVINWYNAPVAGTFLFSGNNYTTPALTNTTTYYAQTTIFNPLEDVGPVTDSWGASSSNNFAHYQVFSNTKPQRLLSVDIRANSAGNRTIELRDASDALITSGVFSLNTGWNNVPLDFDIPVGGNLRLGVWTGTIALYRNSDGATYPQYSTDSSLIVTGNDVPDLERWYFFYNWQLQAPPCETERVPVTVYILSAGTGFGVGWNNSTGTFTPAASGATGYSWDFGDGNTSTDQSPTYTYTAAGTYTVTLTVTANGCTDAISQTVTVGENVNAVQSISGLSALRAYPNPTNSSTVLAFSSAKTMKAELRIINVLGEIVSRQNILVNANANQVVVDLRQLSSGTYEAVIVSDEGRSSLRLVKQ